MLVKTKSLPVQVTWITDINAWTITCLYDSTPGNSSASHTRAVDQEVPSMDNDSSMSIVTWLLEEPYIVYPYIVYLNPSRPSQRPFPSSARRF